ncbi:MAG: hypothetical protein AB1428_13020 [Bacteroidota bacterium]
MSASLSPELKSRGVSEVFSRLATMGWPIAEVIQFTRSRRITFSGKDRPTLIVEDATLIDALLSAEREAKKYLETVETQSGCDCTDRTCEHCVREDGDAI